MPFRFVTPWCAIVFVACACTPQPELPAAADVVSARQAALEFEVRLKRDVLDRLERGDDPVAVYLAYRDQAPLLAREISARSGLEFSRVSLRPRNTSSAADDWEREQIESFQFWREAGIDPAVMDSAAVMVEGEGD